jgi:hypothetical protein
MLWNSVDVRLYARLSYRRDILLAGLPQSCRSIWIAATFDDSMVALSMTAIHAEPSCRAPFA